MSTCLKAAQVIFLQIPHLVRRLNSLYTIYPFSLFFERFNLKNNIYGSNIYLQVLGFIVLVMSAMNSCELKSPMGVSIFEPLNIVGYSGRLPMLIFMALSIVQIATIVSGNENRIMVGNV